MLPLEDLLDILGAVLHVVIALERQHCVWTRSAILMPHVHSLPGRDPQASCPMFIHYPDAIRSPRAPCCAFVLSGRDPQSSASFLRSLTAAPDLCSILKVVAPLSGG